MEKSSPLISAKGIEKLSATQAVLKARLNELVHNQEAEEGERALALSEIESIKTKLYEIDYVLTHAKVAPAAEINRDRITVGATVWLDRGGKTLTVTVVDPLETDPGSGMISHASPLGKALLGKKLLDRLTVETPAGVQEYQVTKIV